MNQLTKKIEKLKLKESSEESSEEEIIKKINPFSGGLSNSEYVKKHVDDSLELSSIFKNKNNIKIITDFLSSYKIGSKNEFKGIIIRGNTGCGKMTLIKACLKKMNYSSLIYDTDCESEDIYDNLILSIEAKGINKLLQLKGAQKKAIIIRDIDNSLRPTQKTDLYKFINMSKNSMPIFMTSNDKTIGTLREVPKCILQLDFEDPSMTEIIKFFWVDNICDKISKVALEKIIHDSKFDLRYIDSIVKGLEFSAKKINVNKVQNFTKDLELDTFECIKFCANPEKTLEQKLHHSTLYTNSTVFHNYPTIQKKESMKVCSEVADMCCDSEQIINYAFENQDWESLYDIYNYLGTVAPLEKMAKNGLNLEKLTYPSSNLIYYKEDGGDFSKLEDDGMLLKVIIPKYFNGNKFIGNLEEFQKETKGMKDPVRSYKIANMLADPKKVNAFLREFKKKLFKEPD